MSYYNNNEPSWQAPGRQTSWEQQPPPSRSGASSAVGREDSIAFASQFEEIERAFENLNKSGKSFVGYPVMGGRRESMPMMAPRPYPPYDARMGPQRHHSMGDYDGMRPGSASNVQGYYQNQRYAPRPNDADQMKRRMAARREGDLRNYHQEQQYNRNVSGSGTKSDRSMSPNAMSEEERRELIARQHRALYGDQSALYTNNNPTSSQDVRVNSSAAGRGPSPLAFDPFGMQHANASKEGAVQMPPRDKDATSGAQEMRGNSNSSPSGTQSFGLFDGSQQANRTSSASPGASPPLQGSKGNTSGVAPIGTRPASNQGQQGGAPLSKRATTPMPSPLSYSYSASEQNNNPGSSSASLNPSSTVTDKGPIWGNNSGVWGNNSSQNVQASVWG